MNQDRITEVWDRQERREAARKHDAAAGKKIDKLRQADGGKDGSVLSSVKVRISSRRVEQRAMRCRPGTFEWRYGRNKQDALFHAGSHFARLWEQAGSTVASSANFLRGTSSGYMTGIAEGRVAAIDKLNGAMTELGRHTSDRLINYCVVGMTTKEISSKLGLGEREAAAVIHQDLRECAMHFRFI